MSGAVCGSGHVIDIAGPGRAEIDMDRTQKIPLEPKRSFERDWKEIRQRLERKIAAAAAQAISARTGSGGSSSGSGGGDIRRTRWPLTPPKPKGPRTYEVKVEDKLTKRGANPRTGVVSPSNRTDSSQEDTVPQPRANQKWKVNGNQWISVDISRSSPSLSSSSADCKINKALSSAGSGTTDASSSSENWEDRFVVNMPSASEPNPPSMSDEEIRRYQQKRGKLYGTGVKTHEMDASRPKPTADHRDTPHPRKVTGIPVRHKDAQLQSKQTTTTQPSPVQSDTSRHYYSPDEVGQTRTSPLSQEPKMKQKELYHKLRAECFMGCVGMDQANAKNPDEVLLFPNSDDDDEEEYQSPSLAPKRLNDNTSVREHSKLLSSQASRRSQVNTSRPVYTARKISTNIPAASRQTGLRGPSISTATPSTTKLPLPSGAKVSQPGGPSRKAEGDIFIRASNVARVAPKPLTRSIAQSSQTRRVVEVSSRPYQGSSLRHNVTTPENDTLFGSSSSENSPTSIPSVRDCQHSRSDSVSPTIESSVAQSRQDSTATSKSSISAASSKDSPKLSVDDIFKNIPGKGPALHEIHSPAEERARNEYFVKKQKVPKTPSVAELDGFQVPHQLPSPPLSTSPSPTAERRKSKDIKQPTDRKDTHTIRMEIRMKAEKARESAEEAKSASSRLKAARQHAERLAEARAAYERVKEQSVAKGVRQPMDELREQKLNTERINEARRAYKAAKAKEEMEKKLEERKPIDERKQSEDKRRLEEKKKIESKLRKTETKPKNVSAPTSSSSTSSSNVETRHNPSGAPRPSRKPRRSGSTRQTIPQTELKQNVNSTILEEPEETVVSCVKSPPATDVNFSFGVIYLSLVNIYDFLLHQQMYSEVLFYSQKLPQMAAHCFLVCKRLAEAYIEYKKTGVLPRSCTDNFGEFAKDIGQALVNFAILGLAFIVVGRAAGYIVLVASWIVWFCRPFGWFFGKLIGR